MIVGLIATVYLAFSFSLAGIALLPDWPFYPGIAPMVLGIFLRQWSIALLGGFFSVLVSIQEGQTIIRKGPYRYIRPPSYMGGNYDLYMDRTCDPVVGILMLVLLLAFCVIYGYRIRIEEKYIRFCYIHH